MAVRDRRTSARAVGPPVDPRPLVERLAPLNGLRLNAFLHCADPGDDCTTLRLVRELLVRAEDLLFCVGYDGDTGSSTLRHISPQLGYSVGLRFDAPCDGGFDAIRHAPSPLSLNFPGLLDYPARELAELFPESSTAIVQAKILARDLVAATPGWWCSRNRVRSRGMRRCLGHAIARAGSGEVVLARTDQGAFPIFIRREAIGDYFQRAVSQDRIAALLGIASQDIAA